MSNSRTKKTSLAFWAFYVLIVILFIGFWAFVINGVIKKDLAKYEAAQPEYFMEDVVAKIQAGDISDMDFAQSSSRFESGDIYKETYAKGLEGKTITFKENPTSYDAQAPIYELYADEEHIATVNLKSTSSEQVMFILSVQDWAVDSVVPIYEKGDEGITISIPDNYTAYVNGVQLDERELVGEPAPYKEFEIVAQYIDVPKEINYAVSGLMSAPTVEVRDAAGNTVQCNVEGNAYSVGFVAGEVPEDIAKTAIEDAKNISEIYAGDRTLSSMKVRFPEDSYLIPLFQNYINFDLWMYSGHTAPTYSDETTSNYIRYNDNFYSVEVSFSKTMYLPKRNMTVTDDTHNTYYYAYINGQWLIADMYNEST